MTRLTCADSALRTEVSAATNNNQRAVVSGGAGFIGSHLCEALLARGMRVLSLDNFITGSRDNLPKMVQDYLGAESVEDTERPFVHRQQIRVSAAHREFWERTSLNSLAPYGRLIRGCPPGLRDDRYDGENASARTGESRRDASRRPSPV